MASREEEEAEAECLFRSVGYAPEKAECVIRRPRNKIFILLHTIIKASNAGSEH